MAHPSKFVSVNLNKSYGKPANPSSNARARTGPYPSAAAASRSGGGGMVVLSRSSSALYKSSAPKLSVPPPLNLPSLRKENEKLDSSTSGSSARPGSSGIGSGPGAGSVGWTKPAALFQEKETSAPRSGAGAYMPPAARPPSSPVAAVEKAVFLRGEDFPSLKAATFASPNPKQLQEEREKAESRSPLPMRPQMRPSRLVSSNEPQRGSERAEKQPMQDKHSLGPLPLVKLAHKSDWADDERDTGLSLPERDRDYDRGFPRIDDEKDLYRGDRRDAVNSWRGPPLPSPPQLGYDRDRFRPKSHDGLNNGNQDSRYPRRDLGFGTNVQNGKNLPGEGFSGRSTEQQHMRSGRFGDPSNNRYRGDSFMSNTTSKVPFSAGSKGLSVNDPILNFGRDKRLSSNGGKEYLGDAGFDRTDPFSDDPIADVNLKVFKRKKEVLKQTDFHDPVRASFEAELERVQRIQEQERQKAMEEQARVMEFARREQEERERLVREEEERRRLIEEEAREAAWRAEHEKMETARRAEEQKIAREEEKRRILMEEERRKEAARKKLLELEARIAKRQTGAAGDEQVLVPVKERDVPKVESEVGDWEDGERMVEHITSTQSSDLQNMDRYFETGSSRTHPSRDGNSSLTEGGEPGYGSSSVLHLKDQEGDIYCSSRDDFSSERPFSKKDKFGVFPSACTRPSSKGRTSEYSSVPGRTSEYSLVPDDFRYSRGNKWNVGGDADHFNRNLDVDATDFLDNDKFGDVGWGSGRFRGTPNAPYTERGFQNELDGGFPSFGRSRHSLRQPRVLPPPSISLRHMSSRNESNSAGPSSFLNGQSRYHNAVRNEGGIMQSGYEDNYQQRDQVPRTQDLLESDAIYSEGKERDSPRCDSQSSLSVSNPPSSPTHLSQDGFDEVEDNLAPQNLLVEEHSFLSDKEHIASELEVENMNTMGTSSLISQGEDDEWAVENNKEINEQEDYDEEDDGYQEEEDAVHDGNGNETLKFDQELDDPLSDLSNKTGKMVSDLNDVEVNVSTDGDFEKTFKNYEDTEVQEDSIGDNSLQNDIAFTEGSVSKSSKTMNETAKALQDLILEPLPTSTSSPLDNSKASTQGMLIQQPITSSLCSPMPSTSTVQSATSTVPAVNQAEAPLRLQFGLFSGPSLIPSPVPAIQIGSIQMPLHLPPQMHPQQPPLFQFGQLRYPAPLSQGMLPLGPQNIPFVHPPSSAQYSLSQNLGGSLHSQVNRVHSSQNSASDKVLSGLHEEQPCLVTKPPDLSPENIRCKQQDEMSNQLKGESASRSQGHVSGYQNGRHIVHDFTIRKNSRPMVHNKETQVYPEHVPSQMSTEGRTQTGSRAPGIISSRGKKFAYSARSSNTRPLFPAPETSRTDSGGFQRRPRRTARRTEFRIRENVDRREREVMDSYSNNAQDGRLNLNGKVSGTSARNAVRKDDTPTKSTSTMVESENHNSGASNTDVLSAGGKTDKLPGKEALSKKRTSTLEASQAGEGAGKGIVSYEDDVGAPLQSGVVCVFRQPGIEVPSDEDDFIEVRSKRQMLNDRREQREKEIKAKSKVIKPPRKHRAVPQSNVVSYNFKKPLSSFVGGTTNTRSNAIISEGRGFPSVEASPVFTSNMTSQALPPIGTPAAKVDSDARSNNLKSSQTSYSPATSSCSANFIPGLPYEKNNTVRIDISLPSDSWSNSDINQQVMALTQSQLDDAMKPVRLDSQVASTISLEPTNSSPAIMAQEKPFAPASPLNSLLAGERIQFGAVTSPTILPPISQAVSNGIGPPGSSRLDVSKDHSLAAKKNDCTMFFDKEKHTDESCTRLEDPEAEAEAAASAVAVAAITNNDEIVGNMSDSDSKSLTCADHSELKTSAGATVGKEVPSQSVAEESLSVALPADLSVDTPLPLWHPLPSPQSTSGPVLSHFPQPSHFPIVDVNPIFGRPIFAVGPHDESGGTHAQPPRSTAMGSGQLGPWPQCHSGVDSFYGHPTGFAGPYITPGGIPGVQAPPHMVVYNHFAPVGQFGQVGLSFMGTTYIPTGKQPDWKHNPVTSATVGASEGEITNLSVASVQCNSPNTPPPIQHLAPGSALMPMASPLPIFDMSRFQSSADISYQARWSHVPNPTIHSIPLTMPLNHQQQHNQQVEGALPSQFGRSVPVDTSTSINRFNAPSSTPDGNRGLPLPNDGANQFPGELRLVDPPIVSTSSVHTMRLAYNASNANSTKGSNGLKNLSRSVVGNASGAGGSSSGGKIVGTSFKPQASQPQLVHAIGYGDQRGTTSQKMGLGSGGEWHRRSGYQGRGHGSGSDKSFGPTKMKQIYVAKRPSSGPATTS